MRVRLECVGHSPGEGGEHPGAFLQQLSPGGLGALGFGQIGLQLGSAPAGFRKFCLHGALFIVPALTNLRKLCGCRAGEAFCSNATAVTNRPGRFTGNR
jgi:hypothetical protein